MDKKKLYIWASDISPNSGEGILCGKYIEFLKKNYQIRKITHKSSNKKTLFHKYIEPFIGIYRLWGVYLRGYSTCYINYLPFWNFLIFLLLPPKTIIGPITGGSVYEVNLSINSLIRKFIFPIMYFLSNIIITFRYKKVLFSTSLLQKNVFKKLKKKSLFNFIFIFFDINKKKVKKKQIVIYYRKHVNKKYNLNFELIDYFINSLKFKIYVVGDNLKNDRFINLGKIKRLKLEKLLSESMFTFVTSENIYSLYSIDSINNNTKILYENIKKNNFIIFKNFYIKSDKFILKKNKVTQSKIDNAKLIRYKKKILAFFQDN